MSKFKTILWLAIWIFLLLWLASATPEKPLKNYQAWWWHIK